MRARAAEPAVHDDAVRVVAQWNIALAASGDLLWSPTIRCAVMAETSSSHFGLPCPTKRDFNGRSGRLSVLESIKAQSPFDNPGFGYLGADNRSTTDAAEPVRLPHPGGEQIGFPVAAICSRGAAADSCDWVMS